HSDAEKSQISGLKSNIPIVWASNYSTGVNTLFWLTRKAAEILGPSFDLEVVEMHHRMKKDAPSGTAATLAEILAAVRKQQLSKVIRHGRQGIVGERTPAEIGMHSLRGGDVWATIPSVLARTASGWNCRTKRGSASAFPMAH